MTTELTGLALLRKPFPANQISKLPKPLKRDAPKGRCAECGGYHGLPAVHLDYVGHAALTDRLLDADPAWTWEPLAMTPDGLPVLDPFGDVDQVDGFRCYPIGIRPRRGQSRAETPSKEIIGDALRNAGMRFGCALDLWHKGDLHADDEETKPDVAAILKNIKASSTLDILTANFNAAMQMLDAQFHDLNQESGQ